MSRTCCFPRLALAPLLLIIMMSCLLLSLPTSASADELLHTFRVAREARLKHQQDDHPLDIHINININNPNDHSNDNDHDNDQQHADPNNNQNTQIVFPAETTNAMWEFQTTPLPTVGHEETQLSSAEGVDVRRTPFQDLIQQLAQA